MFCCTRPQVNESNYSSSNNQLSHPLQGVCSPKVFVKNSQCYIARESVKQPIKCVKEFDSETSEMLFKPARGESCKHDFKAEPFFLEQKTEKNTGIVGEGSTCKVFNGIVCGYDQGTVVKRPVAIAQYQRNGITFIGGVLLAREAHVLKALSATKNKEGKQHIVGYIDAGVSDRNEPFMVFRKA